MNTYEQDETIPIFIFLQYEKYFLKFPINPDNLTKDTASPSESADVEGIGEVSIPGTPKLSKLTIKSFFWHQNNLTPSSLYVSWLERWIKSKIPAKLIVTRLNYSMQVTCENFRHWINAGEEKDIYFELELKEFRPYGAKKLNVEQNKNFLQQLQQIKDKVTPPILVEIPRPSRNSNGKSIFTTPYTIIDGDTLIKIVKKITGTTDDWKLLYEENKELLGDILVETSVLPTGKKLILPSKWVENSSYGIQNLIGND